MRVVLFRALNILTPFEASGCLRLRREQRKGLSSSRGPSARGPSARRAGSARRTRRDDRRRDYRDRRRSAVPCTQRLDVSVLQFVAMVRTCATVPCTVVSHHRGRRGRWRRRWGERCRAVPRAAARYGSGLARHRRPLTSSRGRQCWAGRRIGISIHYPRRRADYDHTLLSKNKSNGPRDALTWRCWRRGRHRKRPSGERAAHCRADRRFRRHFTVSCVRVRVSDDAK